MVWLRGSHILTYLPIKSVSYLWGALSFPLSISIIKASWDRYCPVKSHVEPAGLQYPPAIPQNHVIVLKGPHISHWQISTRTRAVMTLVYQWSFMPLLISMPFDLPWLRWWRWTTKLLFARRSNWIRRCEMADWSHRYDNWSWLNACSLVARTNPGRQKQGRRLSHQVQRLETR